MKRALLPFALLLLAAGPASKPAPTPRDEILGEWRGTSTCTDRRVAPACHDEIVIYRVTPAGGDTARLDAYRITNGEEVAMGVLDFTRDARTGEWVNDMRMNGRHGVWRFRVADTLMTGTLVDVPTKAQIRAIRVTRPPRH
jgi:hypothetical protein